MIETTIIPALDCAQKISTASSPRLDKVLKKINGPAPKTANNSHTPFLLSSLPTNLPRIVLLLPLPSRPNTRCWMGQSAGHALFLVTPRMSRKSITNTMTKSRLLPLSLSLVLLPRPRCCCSHCHSHCFRTHRSSCQH